MQALFWEGHQVDTALLPAWRDILDHLPPFPTVQVSSPSRGHNLTVFGSSEGVNHR